MSQNLAIGAPYCVLSMNVSLWAHLVDSLARCPCCDIEIRPACRIDKLHQADPRLFHCAVEFSPFYGVEKGAVLQEARIFNGSNLDPRRCQQVRCHTTPALNKQSSTAGLFTVYTHSCTGVARIYTPSTPGEGIRQLTFGVQTTPAAEPLARLCLHNTHCMYTTPIACTLAYSQCPDHACRRVECSAVSAQHLAAPIACTLGYIRCPDHACRRVACSGCVSTTPGTSTTPGSTNWSSNWMFSSSLQHTCR